MHWPTNCKNKANLYNHMQALRLLSRSPAVLCGDLNGAIQDIVETLSKLLDGAHIGIWVADPKDRQNWVCLGTNCEAVPSFKKDDLRALVDILERDFIQTIDNASLLSRDTPDPVNFFDNEMCAQLCAGIQIDAQTKGIVSCEFSNSPHAWSMEEIYMAESIANFTSLFLIDHNRRMAEMQLYEAMRNDRLTGLANSTYFVQEFNRKIDTFPDATFYLALLDIRGFRHINDIHGHDVGDEILIALPLEITRRFPDALIGRTASNEFIIARKLDERDDFLETNAKLTELLKTDLDIREEIIPLDISIGSALYPHHANNVKNLIRKCDIALFKAKSTSGASFIAYDHGLGRDYITHIHIKKKLRAALKNKKLINYYQPKVNLLTRETHSGEVLVRWQDSFGNFIPPSNFIPVAEKTGMIGDIGDQVQRNICKDLMLVNDFSQYDHVLSLNASVIELRDPAYVDRLSACIKECGATNDQFEIEVTESTFLDDDFITMENLKQLHRKGFQLALDDFGTGYSSLSYIKQVHFDTIKIDRSFVSNIDRSNQNRTIATSLINLFHSFGCTVVAEGIEREEEADILRDLGCDYGQGYLFAKPMGIDNYLQYLSCKARSYDALDFDI